MSEWQPIETAPADVVVVVGWRDREEEECHDFDYKEDGIWIRHSDHAEHVQVIGGWGVSDTPPYTHWMLLQPLPPAPSATSDEEGG